MSHFNWGALSRTTPISRHFGFDRGEPIDRHYVHQFLDSTRDDIRGRTLEIGDDFYTRQFGGDRTTRRDVLHVHEGNPLATFVGDLVTADQLPSDAFDCIVLTQTLHLIFDIPAALRTVHRILRPGGVVLATFPGISQLSVDIWNATWAWGLTCELARHLFAATFRHDNVLVGHYGNTLAAACFLQGLAAEELSADQLNAVEPDCQMLITVRGQK